MLAKGNLDFSFSGLKTSVRSFLSNNGVKITKADVAAEFQQAILDVLSFKAFHALEYFKCGSLVVAGGVASNNFLRENLIKTAHEKNINIYIPGHNLCTDNGAIIACAGYFRYIKNNNSEKYLNFLDLDASANLVL